MDNIDKVKKSDELYVLLNCMDGKEETQYGRLAGTYDYGDFSLKIEHVPDSPGLRPTRMRAMISLDRAKFPHDVFAPKSRELAARAFLARRFSERATNRSIKMPSVKGGDIFIEQPGRELLETSAVVIGEAVLEVRFAVRFPVKNKRVHHQAATELFKKRIPEVVSESLIFKNVDGEALADWIEANEDADALRNMLADKGLVAFIADGSVLDRSGSAKPAMFSAPEELAVTVELPNRGPVRGMGVPVGITLVTGGFFQGKSTLLSALELGVYNHRFGDGRELAITVPDAVCIRAEEGRNVVDVDLSPVFRLRAGAPPMGAFSSIAAGPAESFAAGLMEALDIGTSLLLFDDETTPSPFLGSDPRVRKLVPDEDEPMARLADILPALRDGHGISSIIVGASGDLLDVADTVIVMKQFMPHVVTAEVRATADDPASGGTGKVDEPFSMPEPRYPLSFSLEPPKEDKSVRPRGGGADFVQYGGEFIEMAHVSQLVSIAQGRALARGISMVHRLMDGSASLKDAVGKVIERIEHVGLDALSNRYMGDLAGFRAQELAAAINRLKRLKVR